MDTHYEPFHKQALDLRYKVQDTIDDTNHPLARVLSHEAHQLVEDIESGRQPRAVEDRVKQIQHQLIQLRAQGNVLDHNSNQMLHHNYEQMRERLRQLPHY
jgi:hypothetical protein